MFFFVALPADYSAKKGNCQISGGRRDLRRLAFHYNIHAALHYFQRLDVLQSEESLRLRVVFGASKAKQPVQGVLLFDAHCDGVFHYAGHVVLKEIFIRSARNGIYGVRDRIAEKVFNLGDGCDFLFHGFVEPCDRLNGDIGSGVFDAFRDGGEVIDDGRAIIGVFLVAVNFMDESDHFGDVGFFVQHISNILIENMHFFVDLGYNFF